MNDQERKEMLDLAADNGVELSDEDLENIAGGFVYHDAGDAASHRKEAYYVVDDKGEIIMRLNSLAKAEHWASNLRTSQRLLSADEFEKLRKKNGLA